MHSWKSRSEDDMVSYYDIIHDAFTLQYGVGILRVPDGLDISVTDTMNTENEENTNSKEIINNSNREDQTIELDTIINQKLFQGKVKMHVIYV